MSDVPMDELPVYLPNPRICRMEQYHCCKHRQHCRLWSRCSQMQVPTTCPRNCPTCDYNGCSLSPEHRLTIPVYVHGVIQEDRLDLNLGARWSQEQTAHRKRHNRQWYYYNCLFGDLKERHRESNVKYRLANPEKCRESARRYWRKKHPHKGRASQRKYYPPCGLKCDACEHPDCILPENWSDQLIAAAKMERDPDYYKRYLAANRERIVSYRKDYYAANRKEIRAKQKSYYQQPGVKSRLAEKRRKYVEENQAKVKAYKKAWYEQNKARINAERRAKRHEHR